MNIKITFFSLFFIGINIVVAQEEIAYPEQTTQSHNLLIYNQYLLNPAWHNTSLSESYISLMHRRQWAGVSGAPKNYLASYASKASFQKSAAATIFHQQFGAFSSTGGNLNLAYGVQFAEATWLRLGANIDFTEYSLDRTAVTNQADPAVLNYEDRFLIGFKPGLSFQVQHFAIGIYAHNLLTYNTSAAELIQDKKRFSGLLSYQTELFKDDQVYLQGVLKGRQTQNDDTEWGVNANLRKEGLGWLQTGYDSFYGFSAGVGFDITDGLVVSYLVEKSFSEVQSDFGASHEVMLAYRFRQKNENRSKNTVAESQNTYDEQELEALKKKIAENNKKQDQLQQELDSLRQQQQKQAMLPRSEDNPNQETAPRLREDETEMDIRTNQKEAFEEVSEGFYVIANVFSQESNATSFLEELRQQGLAPGRFLRKDNQYHYVYIKHLSTKAEAVNEVQTDVDGRYTGEMWILEIR